VLAASFGGVLGCLDEFVMACSSTASAFLARDRSQVGVSVREILE